MYLIRAIGNSNNSQISNTIQVLLVWENQKKNRENFSSNWIHTLNVDLIVLPECLARALLMSPSNIAREEGEKTR